MMITNKGHLERKKAINNSLKLIEEKNNMIALLKKQVADILKSTINNYGDYFMTLGEMRGFISILKSCNIPYRYDRVFNVIFSIDGTEYVVAKI